MAKIGYGLTKQDLPHTVKSVLDQAEKDGYVTDVTQKFKDNLPSTGWIYSFLNRHPNVSARTPENLGFQRAYVSEEGIRKWFGDLAIYLKDEQGLDAKEFLSQNNGDRIFNIDESGFPLQGTAGKCQIITDKGSKNVYRLAPDTKQQIMVLACVSASGSL